MRGTHFTLAATETDEGRPTTGKRFGRSAMAARAASGGAPAWETTLTATVQVGDPPPSVESVREASARQINGGGLLGGDDSVGGKIHTGKTLFIGKIPSTRSQGGLEPNPN
jgi:hypothetical protein